MFTRHPLVVIGITHGYPDDVIQLDRAIRCQSVVPKQVIVIASTKDPRVNAQYVAPKQGNVIQALQDALLLADAAVVVPLDSAYDVLPDHVETLVKVLGTGITPLPTPGHLAPYRLDEALGVGGYWTMLDLADDPFIAGLELVQRIEQKYSRRIDTSSVRCTPVPGRNPVIKSGKMCGLEAVTLVGSEKATSNRALSAGVMERLLGPCPYYTAVTETCDVGNGTCRAGNLAFGADPSIQRWRRHGRIRREWFRLKGHGAC